MGDALTVDQRAVAGIEITNAQDAAGLPNLAVDPAGPAVIHTDIGLRTSTEDGGQAPHGDLISRHTRSNADKFYVHGDLRGTQKRRVRNRRETTGPTTILQITAQTRAATKCGGGMMDTSKPPTDRRLGVASGYRAIGPRSYKGSQRRASPKRQMRKSLVRDRKAPWRGRCRPRVFDRASSSNRAITTPSLPGCRIVRSRFTMVGKWPPWPATSPNPTHSTAEERQRCERQRSFWHRHYGRVA